MHGSDGPHCTPDILRVPGCHRPLLAHSSWTSLHERGHWLPHHFYSHTPS